MNKDDFREYKWAVEKQPIHALPQPCFCVGPQNGDPVCPCAMRNRSATNISAWLAGFRAGQKSAESDK